VLVRYFPTKLNRRCAILQRRIRRQLSELVEARRQRIRIEGGVYGFDLLGLMLEDEGKAGGSGGPRRFTTQQMIDECRTFFFAGHETTAGLLAWTMVLLSVHQEWQERVRREVLEACGGDAEALDPNALSKLKLVKKQKQRTKKRSINFSDFLPGFVCQSVSQSVSLFVWRELSGVNLASVMAGEHGAYRDAEAVSAGARAWKA
jgi:hypothetical protein